MDYLKPPITECVVEFRFIEEVAFEVIQKRIDKFKRQYPNETHSIEFSGEFSEKGFVGKQDKVGLRLTSADELQIVIINKTGFVVSQLAPYPGWQAFGGRVMRDFELFTELFGRKTISRIGLRYINRIDIPLESANVHDYLNVYPMLPKFGQTVGRSFALQSTHGLEDRELGVTLQSATIDSPVPKAVSFVLDIDVFTTGEVPKRTDLIRDLLSTMRATKNDVFEASITQNSRDLFL